MILHHFHLRQKSRCTISFDLCRKDTFTDVQTLEEKIGIDIEQWRLQALPLGSGSGNETALVETLQLLVQELQRDARRMLEEHVDRATDYADRVYRLSDDVPEPATQKFRELREKVLRVIREQCQLIWGLEDEEIDAIDAILIRLEQNADAFLSPKEVLGALLDVINTARRRKYAARPRAAQPMSNVDDVPALREALQLYSEKTFEWHKRQAILRHDYRLDRSINDDYTAWKSLVQETTLCV